MPLETATYISQLNSANPVHGDQLSQDDSHMRLVKSTLQATFPNFTAAPLNSTQAQLDAGVANDTNGVTILADAGVHFKTNTGDGFSNPAAGEVDIKCGGSVVAQVKSGDNSINAPKVAANGVGFVGAGTMPIGGSCVWWSNTLPAGAGTWAWLNGQAVSRATYASLFAIVGTTYGAGDGLTTFNLPDLRETVPVGRSAMGGTAARGLIAADPLNALASTMGEAYHQLTVGEIPTGLHTLNFNDPGHGHNLSLNGGNAATVNVGVPTGAAPFSGGNPQCTNATLSVVGNTTGISASLTDHGGNGFHNNMQPSLACNWIIRVL